MAIVTRKHHKLAGKQLKRIRAAVQDGKRKKARWLGEEWLRSFEAKRLAAHMAYRKMPVHYRPEKSELDAIAKALNPWSGTDEEVIVGIRRKVDDPHDFRHTMSFGIENRALQYLTMLVLRELVELHPDQYALRGMHAAIEAAVKAMSEGYGWAIEYDIKDCYPSFNGKELSNILPLPKKVSEAVLLGEHLNLKGGQSLIDCLGCDEGDDWEPVLFNDLLATARRGLPQGSAVSPLVAEALLADTIHMVPKLGVVVAYADNFLLLAKSKGDVVAMSKALWSALIAHPAGPFKPKTRVFDVNGPISFLGHKLAMTNGLMRITPEEHNLQKFKARVKFQLVELSKPKLQPVIRQKRIEELKRYIRSWCAAFKLCDSIDEVKAFWLARAKWAVYA
jgi:hypothetical protein